MKRFVFFAVSRWYQFVVLVACAGLVAFVLSGTGANLHVIALVCLTMASGWLTAMVFGFFHVAPTWKAFDSITESATPLDSLSSPTTSTPELDAGMSACETLIGDAQTRLGTVTASTLEYRDYVESWVHEIKTPIATAYVALENVRHAGSNQIALQLDRIESYVDQALFYARSSSLERDYFISRLNVKEVVSAAVRERRRSLIDANMSIDMAGIDSDASVHSDEKWLIFMLGQLIDNAVKYRKTDSSVQPSLAFSSSYDGVGNKCVLVLRIADNGRGISEADLPRVFDKGFTGAHGRARGEKATGLGLYLVATLAQKMGIEVRADSREGAGAEFSFLFPAPHD